MSEKTGTLRDIASCGLKILITELDVLDLGPESAVATRDRNVADMYGRFRVEDRKVTVASLAAGSRLTDCDIQAVRLLGCEAAVSWNRTAKGLDVELPAKPPGDGPCVLRIKQR